MGSDGKLRAGVIGARLGASHAYAYANSPEYELAAVCDLMPQVIDEMWDRAKLERGSVATYGHYQEMLETEDLDVVSVTVPDHLHADPVCDASNAGVRGDLLRKAAHGQPGGRRQDRGGGGAQRHEDVRRPHAELRTQLPGGTGVRPQRRSRRPDADRGAHGRPPLDALQERDAHRRPDQLLRRGQAHMGHRGPRARLRGLRDRVQGRGRQGPRAGPRLDPDNRVREQRQGDPELGQDDPRLRRDRPAGPQGQD